MNSLRKISRIAGFGYLIIFITGIYANFFVLQGLVVPDNATETVINISSNGSLFRVGILSFIIMVVFDVILAWALYILLKPTNKNLSLLTAWLRLVNATIFSIALFNLFSVLELLSGADYLAALEPAQSDVQVMLLLDSFNKTWLLGLVFFGIHLFLLGYLIFKSGYIPRIIGILLFIAGIGYLIDSFANFLMPNYPDYANIFLIVVIVPGVIGELSITIWLLFMGVKDTMISSNEKT
jgi:hypothetical protein